MDTRLLGILQCVRCGNRPLAVVDRHLSCNRCDARYLVDSGVPIMYVDGTAPRDLVYAASPYAPTTGSGFRNWLRRNGLESAARWLWRAYVAIDARLAPGNPAMPEFWLGRVASIVTRGQKNVLDLGGGSGPYRGCLASEHDLYVILEVDPASQVVRGNAGRHLYVIGDAHTGVFGDCSFDLITMFEVLEHVRDPFAVFAQCGRWLRPGGLLVLSAPQYWHLHGWPSDYFRYTVLGLTELARRAELEMVDAWAMGGPCVLLWCVADLNFAWLLRLPPIRQLVSYPMLLCCRLLDRLFFPHNERRRNPDTKGWIVVARKRKENLGNGSAARNVSGG